MKIKLSFVLVLLLFLIIVAIFFTNSDNGFQNNIILFTKTDSVNEEPIKLLKNSGFAILKKNINFYSLNSKNKRIKFTNIKGDIYQSLVFTDNMEMSFKVKNIKKKLMFTIFNPSYSNLTYIIKFTKNNKVIFKKKLDKKTKEDIEIILPEDVLDEDEISFRTIGKGNGIWINPVFSNLKEEMDNKIIILIVLDTLRKDHTTVYGYKRDTTPNLKKLSNTSTVYSDSYSTTSWTLPAHVSLFSGRYLSDHKVVAPGTKIFDSYPLLAEFLQKKNFFTAAYTGGGFVSGGLGFSRGFMEYSNNPGDSKLKRSSEIVVERFKNFMEKYKGNNMFLFLHTYQIHAPYNRMPSKYKKIFNNNLNIKVRGIRSFIKNRHKNIFQEIEETNKDNMIDLYDAGIYYADKYLIGGVVDYLKENNLYDNSVIIVTSDHGEEFYDHGSWEHGGTLYNELVKIPLIIKGFRQTVGKMDDKLTSIIDIPAIILSQLGYKDKSFKTDRSIKNRVIKMNIPASPIIKELPPRMGFVNKKYKYIYSSINRFNKHFFVPAPNNVYKYEVYKKNDVSEKKNIYKVLGNDKKLFLKMIKKEKTELRKIKIKNNKIDKELEKKLKSLGYF